MTGKNTYLSISEFNDKSQFDSSNLECTIDGIFFRKSDALNASNITSILSICKKYNNFDIDTLIVKNNDKLTIWIEEKAKKNNIKSVELKEKQTTPTSAQPQVNMNDLPTKTITRRYRGQVYEETVLDWLAVEKISEENKPRRKYRGQYID
ncbi:hypothetical protein I4641_07940 [Waterburya agarophytonicola K14]|uniref:Uncharacterized protein n=1 Tax=Waterburya agarophytonicola KI4 TaxID=2874699 RepID=A0A964FGW4_9CYAN|nr:hypothetical protein [Waterburya agarophytonicola]MCC0176908.1 hypothetical protein [Waterburya agarophytonicola KI4]